MRQPFIHGQVRDNSEFAIQFRSVFQRKTSQVHFRLYWLGVVVNHDNGCLAATSARIHPELFSSQKRHLFAASQRRKRGTQMREFLNVLKNRILLRSPSRWCERIM